MCRWGKLISLLSLTVFAASACGGSKPSLAGATLWAYGHSYVQGVQGEGPPWVASLASSLHLPLVDNGHGGDLAAQCLNEIPTAGALPGPNDLVIIECDVNDVLEFGTDPAHLAAFRATYAQILQRLDRNRPRIIAVEDPSVERWNAYAPYNRGSTAAEAMYNAAIQADAASMGSKVTVAKISDWNPATMTAADGIHPNPAGKAALVAAVAPLVESH